MMNNIYWEFLVFRKLRLQKVEKGAIFNFSKTKLNKIDLNTLKIDTKFFFQVK